MSYLISFHFLRIILDRNSIADKMGDVIAKMHQAGIVHGDLTTSNLMLRKEGNNLVNMLLLGLYILLYLL
jgi:tRNA A-37 threonylcarbamoyl transferase component Bud32